MSDTPNLNVRLKFNLTKLDRLQRRRITESTFDELFEQANPTLLADWSYHHFLESWIVRRNALDKNSDSYPDDARRAIHEEEFSAIRAALRAREKAE